MNIKMKTLAAGPQGTLHPDQVINLPEKDAKAMIAGGYAVALVPAAPAEKKSQKAETAVLSPPENAALQGAGNKDVTPPAAADKPAEKA